MIIPRITVELDVLREGGMEAEVITANNKRDFILYRSVPTAGASRGLPVLQDVIVPVPAGYPGGGAIDLAGLPTNSPLLPLVKGGSNSQGLVEIAGLTWQLASYHPHGNGGGPPWDQNRHGFHTYVDHLIAWLHRLG